jgi:hypothetical protein
MGSTEEWRGKKKESMDWKEEECKLANGEKNIFKK